MGPADEVNVVSVIVLSEDLIVGSRLIRSGEKEQQRCGDFIGSKALL
jgi:hypothetical protein